MEIPRFVEELVEFIGHMVSSAVLFVVIGLMGWGLGVFVHWLEGNGTPMPIVYGLTGLEYILFGGDALLAVNGVYRGIARLSWRSQ